MGGAGGAVCSPLINMQDAKFSSVTMIDLHLVMIITAPYMVSRHPLLPLPHIHLQGTRPQINPQLRQTHPEGRVSTHIHPRSECLHPPTYCECRHP